tara:strand:- start:453 stop:1001 length:549 start_codon:yes stop_codon:yes gene_type:complete
MSSSLEKRLRRIKLLISDVDGVLTDGSIYKGNDGVEYKQFSILDGAAVAFARAAGLKLAVISGRYSPATTSRMEELGIDDCYQGDLDKMKPYGQIIEKYGFQHEEVSFIGDDLIDVSVMEKVGMAIAVKNAHTFVKEIAHFTTETAGGEGALREAVELILKGQGVYDDAISRIKQRYSGSNE